MNAHDLQNNEEGSECPTLSTSRLGIYRPSFELIPAIKCSTNSSLADAFADNISTAI